MSAVKWQTDSDRENYAYCRSVSLDLSAAIEGHLLRCPKCGADIIDDGACCAIKCTCGFRGKPEDDFEQVTLYEYFENVFDIEYSIDGDSGDYRGVRLMIACGGPNVYVDTRRKEVFLAWGGDYADAYLPTEVCDEIDQIWEESYQCLRERKRYV